MQLQKLISEHRHKMIAETLKITDSGKADQALSLIDFVSENLVNLHVSTHNIIRGAPDSTNRQIPGKVDQALELQKLISEHIVDMHEDILKIIETTGKGDQASTLKKVISEHMVKLQKETMKLIRKLAKKIIDSRMCQESLYRCRENCYGLRERKNEDGLTPHELFTKEHKDLVSKGEDWMKVTASQCMVVAALIATIVFAAAFTIPGGYDQNNGLPMFQSKATLIIFIVADAISLFSSSASILIFLAILTSRYAERDFLESLPRKLMFGLATLFLSIATMTVAFSVSFFVLYRKGFLWVPIVIGVFAVMPVILYIVLQYSLFFDVIRSTYGSRYLFKPKKQVLYYSNPKVW